MPLQNSSESPTLQKTKIFELDGREWMTDETTLRILERHTSLGTESTGGWYFAFCLGAGKIVPAPASEAEN
jgi:hypothetical protein